MFKHEHIINAIPDSLMVLNGDCEIVFTNDSWKNFNIKTSGNSKNSESGLKYLKIRNKVTNKDKERDRKAHKGILSIINKETDLFEMEYPCHSADGLIDPY